MSRIGILVPMVILYVVLLMWSIASYIITSSSLFSIGKQLKIRAYGLAWAPIVNIWSVGAIADKYDECNGKNHGFRYTLLWLMAAFILFFTVFILMYLLNLYKIIDLTAGTSIQLADRSFTYFFWTIFSALLPMSIVASALSAVEYICFYKLLELCKPETALKNLLIGLLIPFAFPFVLLSGKRALQATEVDNRLRSPNIIE